MVDKFSSSRLVLEIEEISGPLGFERSLNILEILLRTAQKINENAPIISFLKKDIKHSKPNTNLGHSINIELASGNDSDALVRYLLVPMGGSQRRGRTVEFACRQFEFAVKKGLTSCGCLRSTKSGLYLEAVAAGVFYSEGKGRKNRSASEVSTELYREGLNEITKSNLNMINALINAKEKDNKEEFAKIMADLVAKSS